MSDGEDLNVIRVEVAHHFGISAERLVKIDRRRRVVRLRADVEVPAEPWSR